MCVQELTWAIDAGKSIVPVVTATDKPKVGEYIDEGKRKGIDLSACDFKHVDSSNPTMLQASIQTILDAMKSSPKAKYTETAEQRSAGAASSSAQHERQGGHQKEERSDEGIETGGYAITGNESACGEAAAAPKNAPEQALEQAAEDPAQRKRSFRRQLSDHFGFHADDAPLKEASGRDFGRASSSEKHAALEQRRLSSCKSTGTPPQDAVRV